MIDKVQATNAAFRRHGVAQEFVIAVSSPRDPSIPREVKILSRRPRDTSAEAARNTHAPVDPSNSADTGTVVDIGVGTTDYARDVGRETGQVVKTEYGENYVDPAMLRRDLTWEHTGTRIDVDSVLVLGDALQTLPMMFADRSVKRLFINNVNAHYVSGSEQYLALARGLRRVMKSSGRVEIQWTTASETTGGKNQSRGHVTGEALKEAISATAMDVARTVSVAEAAPVTDYNYSVEAPRTKSGIPSKQAPTNPVPEKRWIFTFGD